MLTRNGVALKMTLRHSAKSVILLFFLTLAFVSGCKEIGTAKFDEVAAGTGEIPPTPTPPGSIFAGISSIGSKTDSTATLYWTPHLDAINYLIYDVTSGSPVLLQTISDPTASNLNLTGLTADVTYKFRVRMENGANEIDSNTKEISVTMNHAPEVPATPSFHTPATSPGTVNRPTLTINGVKTGDVVKIYTDACSTEVASGTVGANQTSINLQVSNALAANTYSFFANSSNAQGYSSSCTSSSLTYVLTFSFSGLTSSSNKTDSTVTLNWSTHPNAVNYILYDVSSGTPAYLQTISNPATSSLTLTGLTPDATKKYRLRMTHDQGATDENMNDLTVVMNHAPDTPNGPLLFNPTTSPGTEKRPTFTVSGVKTTDTVKLYSDSACSAEVASATVSASGTTSVQVQVAQDLAVGVYSFAAKSVNQFNNSSGCSLSTDYEVYIPPYYLEVVSGSATPVGSADMSMLINGSVDDQYIGISLPFNFYIAGNPYANWFVGSNTYITAGTGSTTYGGLSASNPSIPKFHLGAADNSYQRVFTISGQNYMRVRYEGSAGTGGTVGSPNIVYEVTFYKPTETNQYVQVVFGTHNRTTGQFGVANSSAYYVNGGTITPNSSYVFVSNLVGTSWTMYPNSRLTGQGLNE